MKKDELKTKYNINELTLEEKLKMLSGSAMSKTAGIERFGVKPMRLHDGPNGLRRFLNNDIEESPEFKSAFPGVGSSGEMVATAFPTGSALGATWNKEMVKKVGEALAEECAAYQVSVILGPAVNIKRHPLCGRNFEYISEDPVLSGELGTAYVNGVQSKGIATCPKHYIANNQEEGRFWVSSEMDERTMREIYLLPFEKIVKNASPWSIMCSYNRLNGIYTAESRFLMDKVLRQEWGFDGAVISDWGAVKNRARSLKAKLDICMPPYETAIDELKSGLERGLITEKDIDEAVENVLMLHERTKDGISSPGRIDFESHHEIARAASAESITMLKNNGILPLNKDKLKKLLIIGNLAVTPAIGGDGSSRVGKPWKIDSPLDEIKKIVGEEVEIELIDRNKLDTEFCEVGSMELNIQRRAKLADAVIIFVSQHFSTNSETIDRNDIFLPPYLSHAVRAARRTNENIIVVANIGSSISTTNFSENASAILISWLGGQGMGNAIARTLFGELNPSGKLAETFPKRLEDVLSYQNYPGDGLKTCYKEGLMVGYRHYDTNKVEPEYPFGFGLSYTTFSYRDLSIERNNEQISVIFKVKNTGNYEGSEVVQLYVEPPKGWVSRPVKELKAFDKAALKPGEEKTIILTLEPRDFMFYSIELADWFTDGGIYKILIGASSRDIRLSDSIAIEKSQDLTLEHEHCI
jgi:beta-glucosidase